MSRKTYGSSNVNWGSFDEWSNVTTSDTNAKISQAKSDMYPAQTSPWSAGTLRNTTIFKGTINRGDGGTIALSAPYTVAATTSAIVVKNVFLSSYNITIVAAASYPWTFHSWRTASGGGGSAISTSATFTITNDGSADYATYWAYFTTSHSNPYA